MPPAQADARGAYGSHTWPPEHAEANAFRKEHFKYNNSLKEFRRALNLRDDEYPTVEQLKALLKQREVRAIAA